MTRRRATVTTLLLAALALAGVPALAGDITVFVGAGRPTDTWNRGYGAALTSTLLGIVALEGEAARMPGGQVEDDRMTSFTGSALLAPSLGIVTPYGGLGFGLFRQSIVRRSTQTDTGRLKAMVLGVKVKLGGLLVIKGEYRRFDLSGEPLLDLDSRLSVGAGISF